MRDLGSKRAEVRASAARDLGVAGQDDPAAAAEALAAIVADANAAVRADAALALGLLGHGSAVPYLRAMLDDADATVRQHAAVALGQIGDAAAIEALDAARTSEKPDVRYQALIALGSADPKRGLDAATAALADADVWVASEAALELAHLHCDPIDDATARARAREHLRDKLTQSKGRVALCAAMALARLGDERARPTLVSFLARKFAIEASDDAADLRLEALERLADLGPEASAFVAVQSIAFRVMGSPEREVARAVLAGFGEQRTLEKLIAQLESPWSAQRQSAVASVRVGRVRAAVPALLRLLASNAVEPFLLVEALAATREPAAHSAIEAIAADEQRDEDVRAHARTHLTRSLRTP